MDKSNIEFSIVIPCLNEEKTLGIVVEKAQNSIKRLKIKGEVVVADNGSTDRSIEIAELMGARVVHCAERGYGNALKGGFSGAYGKYLIHGDADDSYDFSKIEGYVHYLRKGYDLVIGTRIKGRIEKGAMPFLHRYLGTPVLTFILNRFFGTRISDCNCGMRGLTREAFEKMKLTSGGMEFASEMVIKAGILKLRIKEIPITLYRDKREGRSPHLRTWSDGWRHLRFMLLYAPNSVFIWPGAILFAIGTLLVLLQINGPFRWNGIYMDIHFMILGLTLGILGVSIFQMGLIIKLFSHLQDYYRQNAVIKWLSRFSLEKGLIAGGIIFLLGFLADLYIVIRWIQDGFQGIVMPRTAIIGLYLMFLGATSVFFSFMRAIMENKIDEKKH